jgi:hypothetical protein
MSELEDTYQRLLSSTHSLLGTAERCLPEIHEALDPASKLPDGCPSRASMAEMIYRDVKKWFREVETAVHDVESAIWRTQNG